jgi:hypothetical protein
MTLVRRRSSPNKYNADSVERLVNRNPAMPSTKLSSIFIATGTIYGFSAAKRVMQAETFAHQDEGADGARRGPADDLSGSAM